MDACESLQSSFNTHSFIVDQSREVIGSIECTEHGKGVCEIHLVFYPQLQQTPDTVIQMYLLADTKDIKELCSETIKTKALELYENDFISFFDAQPNT